MKKSVLLPVFCILVASSARLMAFSVGGYAHLGGNGSDLYEPHPKYTYNNLVFGFGMTLGMDLTKDDFVQYRNNLGYDVLYNDDLKCKVFHRIGMMNSFGFRILKGEKFRLYAGPQIAFRYQFCDADYTEHLWGYAKQHYHIDMFSLGLGAMIGVDLPLTDRVTLSPEVGMRYEFITGKAKNKIDNYIWIPYERTIHQEYTAHGFEGTVGVTVLYRI